MSVLWKSIDPRVSKEKLEVKFYINCRSERMSIQHGTTNIPFKYRIEISFNKFMGLKLSSGILTADVYGYMYMDICIGGTWKEEQNIKNTSTRVVLVIIIKVIQRICRQIWNEYHRFVQHFISFCAMTIPIFISLTVINLTIASHSLEIQPLFVQRNLPFLNYATWKISPLILNPLNSACNALLKCLVALNVH